MLSSVLYYTATLTCSFVEVGSFWIWLLGFQFAVFSAYLWSGGRGWAYWAWVRFGSYRYLEHLFNVHVVVMLLFPTESDILSILSG